MDAKTAPIIDKMSEVIGRPFTPSRGQVIALRKLRYTAEEITQYLPYQIYAWRVKLAKQLGVPDDCFDLVTPWMVRHLVSLTIPTKEANKTVSTTDAENRISGQHAYDLGLAVMQRQHPVHVAFKAHFGRWADDAGYAFYSGYLDDPTSGFSTKDMIADMLKNGDQAK